ncbi:MAG: hypothetical protein HY225_02255 [Candidatus Vogelbacteria bacterium]|nr:hypothetical protein [Candidatus Vogelbacteria bacterium]
MTAQKLPVFPNWFPYNDMLLDGHMKVDGHEGVKSRCWEWNYRGPVLLYNSLRTAKPAVKAYDYTNSSENHKVIVGVGELVEVRGFTVDEAAQMLANFNNISLDKIKIALRNIKRKMPSYRPEEIIYNFFQFGPYIAPFRTGFFFKNLRRFDKPVSFNWPAGPIKPIFTQVVPGSELGKQLKRAGF